MASVSPTAASRLVVSKAVLGDDRHAASTGWFARTGLGDAGLGNIGRVDFAARSGGQGERGGD